MNGDQYDGRAQHGKPMPRVHVPSVREAMIYTPFTSIIPYDSGIVPTPSFANPRPIAPKHDGSLQPAREMLASLSAGATRAENASERCQKTLRDVQRLIHTDDPFTYTFRRPTDHRPRRAGVSKPVKLSGFAQMIFDNAAINHNVAQRDKEVASRPKAQKTMSNHQATNAKRPVQHDTKIAAPTHVEQNGALSHGSNAFQNVAQRTNGYGNKTVLQSASTLRTAPRLVQHQDTSMTHLNSTTPANKNLARPHAKVDNSIVSLQSQLQDIFDAEDQFNNGYNLNSDETPIVEAADGAEGPAITYPSLVKVEHTIVKVVKTSSLGKVQVTDLKRLQRLCEHDLAPMIYASLQTGDDWTDLDVEEWQRKLKLAEKSLYAVRILLRVMTAASGERELQSEETLKSILQVLKNIAETGIVSFVEERSPATEKGSEIPSNSRFAIARDCQDELIQLLRSFGKILQLLSGLLAKVHVDETAISSIVYMSKILIFAENATSEKDAVIGIQVFESCRKHALDVLAQIFSKYADQRQFIFDEILVSLEKLPATKQNARQYHIADHKPIQLVSALVMQLIQTGATVVETKSTLTRQKIADSDDEESDSDDDQPLSGLRDGKKTDLQSLISAAERTTQGNAMYFSGLLTRRALNLSKNADEPYRKLLDIFIDDFLNVLGSTDWPAAELLLRSQLGQLFAILENSKSTAPARNFALEMLGKLASGILDSQSQAQSLAGAVSSDMSDVSILLKDLLDQTTSGLLAPEDLTSLTGPYRIVVEYLHLQSRSGTRAQTAINYHLLQWAQLSLHAARQSHEDDENPGPMSNSTIDGIRTMIQDSQWIEANIAIPDVSPNAARLASAIIILNSAFCKAFPGIFSRLLQSLTSEQATVRSRGLRSVITLIDTDPSVIDRYPIVMKSIFGSAEDSSPLVREAALGLLAKCMTLRPNMDSKTYDRVIQRAADPTTGVRKRAMKMLKDVYLRNDNTMIRATISSALIARMADAEESVVELARQVIEEVWFQPFYVAHGTENGLQSSLALKSMASLIVHTIDITDAESTALLSLIKDLLVKSKQAEDNIRVVRKLIDTIFDGLIDSSSLPGSPAQDTILLALGVFAQSRPRLFTASQLELLEPYTKNLSTDNDLNIFRLALTIFRHTMPFVKTIKQTLLQSLQKDLFSTIGKLPKSTIAEVASCLWTIDGELKNTDKLSGIPLSALNNLCRSSGQDLNDVTVAKRITRLLNIAGQFTRACDLEVFAEQFKKHIKGASGNTVADIAVNVFLMFSQDKQPILVREAAYEAICAVSQRWPKQFLRQELMTSFDRLLASRNSILEAVFLRGFLEFFSAQETLVTGTGDPEEGITGRERLARTYTASDQDNVTAILYKRYLKEIARLATGSIEDNALTATKLLTSILRQGLPHPKECGPSLIALETSPNSAVANLACAEHRTLHEKHETIIEKEYVKSMEQVLVYQQQIVGDGKGWIGEPPAAKLRFFWEVLRGGKAKIRQKYLVNVCVKLGFNPATLDVNNDIPKQLAFVRFMIENLALFEYDKAEDVKILIDNLGKAFATTGTPLAQAIESEVFSMTVEQLGNANFMTAESALQPTMSIDPGRLRTLAVSAQILLLIAETRAVLLKLWSGQKPPKKEKNAGKDSKTHTRANNASTLIEAFTRRIEQLASPMMEHASQINACKAFLEAINIDHDAKVASDEEEEVLEYHSDAQSGRSPSMSAFGTPGGRKRKLSTPSIGGPRKKRPSFERKGSNVSRMTDEDDDADGEWE